MLTRKVTQMTEKIKLNLVILPQIALSDLLVRGILTRGIVFHLREDSIGAKMPGK